MIHCQAVRLSITAASGFRREVTAVRIIAEAANGSFCLLPRHRDFTAVLVAGLFEYTSEDNMDHFLAIDEGLIVKLGSEVSVCTRHAVESDDLESLQRVVDEDFAALDDRERAARAAVARLEADFARRLFHSARRAMSDPPPNTPEARPLSNAVASKQQRRLTARRQPERNIWFGLGMFGLVGWSIAIPALIGVAVGIWIDHRWPSRYSWTLMLLLAGIALGCLQAWRWVHRESDLSDSNSTDTNCEAQV